MNACATKYGRTRAPALLLTSRMPSDIIDGMRKLLKVDAAGRVVLPHPVRKRFHLTPGSRLEIDVEPDGIRLRPSTPAPSLTDEDGLLVHEGEPTGDLLHAVEEARALRDEQVNSALG